MALTWPAGLPQLPQIGWTESKDDNTVSTEMDAGPVKSRRKYTVAVRRLNLPLVLTEAQVAIMDTFHTDTIKDGVLYFEFDHPRDGLKYSGRWANPYAVSESAQNMYRCDVEIEHNNIPVTP